MRMTEWIQLGFALVLAVAAWGTMLRARPLPLRRRWVVTAFASIAIFTIAAAHAVRPLMSASGYAVLLDVATIALFLVPYWQTGQFFVARDERIEARLLAIDRWLLPRASGTSGTGRSVVGLVLEMAYLSCYPLVPLGLIAVYAAGLRDKVEGFWLVLLVATYLCYAVTPLVPAYPPRSLLRGEAEDAAPLTKEDKANAGRLLNRLIVKHGSIHAISFPSAHVASAFAIALVLLYYAPMLGAAFLVIAVMISLGAVIGRYHYALDVILGAVTALGVFVVCLRWL